MHRIDSKRSASSLGALRGDHRGAPRTTDGAPMSAANLHPGPGSESWPPDGLHGPCLSGLSCSEQRYPDARLCLTTTKLLYSTQAWSGSVFLAAVAFAAIWPSAIYGGSSKRLHGPSHVVVRAYPQPGTGKNISTLFLTSPQRPGPQNWSNPGMKPYKSSPLKFYDHSTVSSSNENVPSLHKQASTFSRFSDNTLNRHSE